ncbi:cupredoxin domain-containing protein [Hymenobacter sp. AT01-02]|uniref:cupredoxin domain-containing protein n=1 Tax=Hymenobacter sp. AT01-02 TaxID=1571877 RepID=UPI0005F1A964|nr:cupredoxin domain-containing protein [Hymenobacter sp. AT01-02]
MDTAELFVTSGGLLLIGLVVWYFFFTHQTSAQAVAADGGVQAIDIQVQGGYSPAVVEVEHGRPVQLRFHRAEDNSCSEELLLPDFRIRRELSAFQTTTIELTPAQPGTYEFTCGMHMLRGRLVVR